MAAVIRPQPALDRRGWGVADPGGVRRRTLACGLCLFVVFGCLTARLWYLQVVKGADMLAEAQRNRTRHVPLAAARGLILDRHGAILATSRALHSVAVVPAALPSARSASAERLATLRTLAFLLHITPEEIEEQLLEAIEAKSGNIYDPVRIVRGVDLKTITLIEENKYRLGAAVLVTDDVARSYPNGSLAAHVLGYTGAVSEADIAASQRGEEETPGARTLRYDDTIGRLGIEREYDDALRGEPGAEVYEVDAKARPVRHLESLAETPGHTVTLTLDARLQRAAETALAQARNSGAVAAIDPRNGEVLVLASLPNYDPNIFSLPAKLFKTRYGVVKNNPKKPLINRAVSARFPPGSTYKMITAAAGLQQGTLKPGMVHHCGGGMRLGRFFGCWKTHGSVDFLGAMAGSCDVYFYQTALAMGNPESSGPDYLAAVSRRFGLGMRTGIDLPSDNAGLVPDPEWRRSINAGRPDLAHWYAGNTLNMSIGQGDVLATPLQMAMATAAVANHGTLWRPRLLRGVQGAAATAAPEGKSVGIEPRYLDIVRASMRRVVTDGTGRAVALPNVAVAGKTGSAEDANHALPHAWFVCFAPYDNPEIAIAVMVENAGHGAENAAPIARKVLEAAFPADKNPATPGARRRVAPQLAHHETRRAQ